MMPNLRGLIAYLGQFASTFWTQAVTGLASLSVFVWVAIREGDAANHPINFCWP